MWKGTAETLKANAAAMNTSPMRTPVSAATLPGTVVASASAIPSKPVTPVKP